MSLCAHSQTELKLPKLANIVPGVRKVLEQLIFNVKAVLQENEMASAFWVGNLKHRDIHGAEVDEEKEKKRRQQEQEEDESDDEVHTNCSQSVDVC
jgi:Fanconi anemia group D2 protein